MREVSLYQVAKLGDATGKLLSKSAGPGGKAASLKDLKKHLLDSMAASRTTSSDVILPDAQSPVPEKPHVRFQIEYNHGLFGFRLI